MGIAQANFVHTSIFFKIKKYLSILTCNQFFGEIDRYFNHLLPVTVADATVLLYSYNEFTAQQIKLIATTILNRYFDI
jgi:hypothetical protein